MQYADLMLSSQGLGMRGPPLQWSIGVVCSAWSELEQHGMGSRLIETFARSRVQRSVAERRTALAKAVIYWKRHVGGALYVQFNEPAMFAMEPACQSGAFMHKMRCAPASNATPLDDAKAVAWTWMRRDPHASARNAHPCIQPGMPSIGCPRKVSAVPFQSRGARLHARPDLCNTRVSAH